MPKHIRVTCTDMNTTTLQFDKTNHELHTKLTLQRPVLKPYPLHKPNSDKSIWKSYKTQRNLHADLQRTGRNSKHSAHRDLGRALTHSNGTKNATHNLDTKTLKLNILLDSTLISHGRRREASRHRSRRKKNQEKDAQPEKIKRKMDFSDLRNRKKQFYAAVW